MSYTEVGKDDRRVAYAPSKSASLESRKRENKLSSHTDAGIGATGIRQASGVGVRFALYGHVKAGTDLAAACYDASRFALALEIRCPRLLGEALPSPVLAGYRPKPQFPWPIDLHAN